MVSTRPLIFKSTSPSANRLVTVSCTPITTGIIVSFMFYIFSVLSQGPDTCFSFQLLSVLHYGQPGRQSPLFGRFSFFYVDIRQLQLVSPSLSSYLRCFSSLARSRYLSLFSHSFSFTLWSAETAKTIIWRFLFFHFFHFFFCFVLLLLTNTRSVRLTEIRGSVCISKSQRILFASFSRTDPGLCIYHLFVRSNSNSLHNSQ